MTVVTISGEDACPSINVVQRAVARRFGVRIMDLRSQRRDRCVVRARHAAMFLCRELTPFSLPVIGRHFGRRDHTTVMYACREVERRRKESPEIDRAISRLSAELTSDLDAQREKMMAGPAGPQERAQALDELAPLLSRREALLAELELVDARIDEIGQSTFGAAPPAEAEE